MFPVQDTKRRRLTYPVAVGDVLSCKLLSAENVPCVVDNVDEASCRMLVRRLDPPVTEQEKSKNDLMNFYIRPKDAVPVHEAPAGKIKFDTPQKVDAMTQLWCQKRWESGEDIQVSTFSSCWSALRNADDKTNAEAGDEEDVVFVVQRGPGDEMFGVGRVLKYGVHFSSLNDWKGYFVEVEDAWGVVRDCGLEAIVQGWGMLEPEMREKTKGLAGKMVKAMSAKRGTGAVFGKVVGFVVPARKENVEVVVEQVQRGLIGSRKCCVVCVVWCCEREA